MQVSNPFKERWISTTTTIGLASTLLLLSGFPMVAEPSNNLNRSGSLGQQATDIVAKNSLEAQLAPAVTQRFKELGVPGAIIGVWAKGYQSWIATLGVSNLTTGTPIQPNDKMRIGSITKTFTGTVLLQLVDEGLVNLDDPVSKYLPDVPNGEKITIRQIGNMTSGLFNYSEDKPFGKIMSANPQTSWTPQELVASAFQPIMSLLTTLPGVGLRGQ